MELRLRELDRADAQARAAGLDPYELWLQTRAGATDGGPSRATGRTRRKSGPRRFGRTLRAVVVTVAAVALPIGAVIALGAASTDSAAPAGGAVPFPTAGFEEADGPIGVAAPAPAGPDSYRFVQTQPRSAEPVTWNPCRPIHYATSGIAPVEGQEILASAFRRLHDVTGFQFVNDGPTSEPAVESRVPFQPGRYGDRWAPVLVAWTTPGDVPELGGPTIGRGGALSVSGDGGRRTYVSATLFLDRPQVESELADASAHGTSVTRRAQLRAVMLHELGHVFGLDHVDDPSQLMFPTMRLAITDFGVGDLRGLHALATGPCAPTL